MSYQVNQKENIKMVAFVTEAKETINVRVSKSESSRISKIIK